MGLIWWKLFVTFHLLATPLILLFLPQSPDQQAGEHHKAFLDLNYPPENLPFREVQLITDHVIQPPVEHVETLGRASASPFSPQVILMILTAWVPL